MSVVTIEFPDWNSFVTIIRYESELFRTGLSEGRETLRIDHGVSLIVVSLRLKKS